jgi:hypothetical protein
MTVLARLRRLLALDPCFALALCFLVLTARSQTIVPQQPEGNALLSLRPFLHIPGPNPIISRGAKGSWDEYYIEAGDVFKDSQTYYLYYHATALDLQHWGRPGFRIGVATASNPLGPWTKQAHNPLLDLGAPGSWDDASVACPVILREAPDKFFMWYCGMGRQEPNKKWSIGLATASSPVGPWTKVSKNPVIDGFGYVSSVIKHNGKYLLYSEHPIGSTASDYGPMSLAIADSPEGPWVPWSENPVLPAGEKGTWDDAGYSEAKVLYRDGVFHMFYGGAKEFVPRRLTQESIGYAYSFDGYHFIKYGGNPVALREAVPNAAAFGEVHAFFEPPFMYLFHTIRYVDPEQAMIPGGIQVEDLGVEVLVTQRPFFLPVPIMVRNSLPARASTKLSECPPISLNGASRVSLVAEGHYESGAKAGMRVHIRSSIDGTVYDTTDVTTFENDFQPGSVGRKTVELKLATRFFKATVENLDSTSGISEIKITAVLNGE